MDLSPSLCAIVTLNRPGFPAGSFPCEDRRYKAEIIHRRSRRNLQDVELTMLVGVGWFNTWRLLGTLDDIPPAEAGANDCRQTRALAMAA